MKLIAVLWMYVHRTTGQNSPLLMFDRKHQKLVFQNTCVWIVTDHNQTPSTDKRKRPLS